MKNQYLKLIFPLLTLLILSTSSCFNDRKNTGWAEQNLNGNVRSLTEVTYEAIERFGIIEKGGRLEDFRYINYQLEFDEKGNLTERRGYNQDESLSFKTNYKYNDKGYKTELSVYNPDGSLRYKTIFKTDELGKIIEEYGYDSEGSLERVEKHEYNDNGKIIETKSYKPDGTLFTQMTHKYDEKGNTIERCLRLPNLEEYDIKNVYKHDDKGNVIEENLFHASNNISSKKTTYEYEFDQSGNYIKKIVFENGVPKQVVEREIEYFE